jgi:hypothetical protein
MRGYLYPFTGMNPLSLKIPVYEPAGRDVLLSETDLLQHLLIVGATGSGKTALLHRVIEQMIRQGGGLLIFDPKQDDTVERVRRIAREARREKDVVVLGPDGDRFINLFSQLRSLADVDLTAGKLLLGSGSMGRDNAYWDEARLGMFDAALSLLVAQGKRVSFGAACNFMREWFFRDEKSDHVLAVISAAEAVAAKMSGPEQQKLLQALDTVAMWKGLDSRTRSNILSTLMCAVRPLLSVPASHCFQPYGRQPFEVSEVAQGGRICVASLNAAANPGVAALFFRLVKTDFFRAVQSREVKSSALCGLVADEWPLLATAEDVDALATVRSKRCFVAAAAQGLSVLDERLGTRLRKALLANFGTIVFMKSREEEVDLFAAVHLGTIKRWVKNVRLETEGNLFSQLPSKIRQDVFVCPPGTLGRLSPHQGFVTSPIQRFEYPLSFVPWFDEPQQPQNTFENPASPERLKWLLYAGGRKERMDTLTFRKAVHLCAEGTDRQEALTQSTHFFRTRAVLIPKGLETLPTPWLRGLPGILWATRRPHWLHLPYMIREVEIVNGLLQLHFAQEAMLNGNDERVTAWDRIRLQVNSSLYPSRWRPLQPKHLREMQSRWPEMKPASDPPLLN